MEAFNVKTCLLGKSNYKAWRVRVESMLVAKDWYKIIMKEGNRTPEEQKLFNETEPIAKAMISMLISDAIINSLQWGELTTKSILDILDDKFKPDHDHFAQSLNLESQLMQLRFKDGEKLNEHFNKFHDMLNELEQSGEYLPEKKKILLMINSMSSKYDAVVATVHSLPDQLRNLKHVCELLTCHDERLRRHEETPKVLYAAEEKKSVPKYAQNRGAYRGNRGSRGHRGGYRGNGGHRNQGANRGRDRGGQWKRDNNKTSLVCQWCRRRNHSINDCRAKKQHDEEMVTPTTNLAMANSSGNSTGFSFMVSDKNYLSNYLLNFILDSGSSHHIINKIELTNDFSELINPIKIMVAKGDSYILATKIGILKFKLNNIEIKLNDVLYTKEATHNLLSVKRFTEDKIQLLFHNDGATIYENFKPITTIKYSGQLIHLQFNWENIYEAYLAKVDLNSLHNRIGHMSVGNVMELRKNNMILDGEILDKITKSKISCEPCILAKQTRTPFNKNKDKSHIIRPLQVVHSDICTMPVTSNLQHKYFATFIDQYTHYTCVYLLKEKSELFEKFKDYVGKSEVNFNKKIQFLYIDNGTEYLSNAMKSFCSDKGITYHLTVPHTPQLNGVSERMNRTILEKTRVLLKTAKLPDSYWGDAVLTATFLINITPTKALEIKKTPYELWHNKKPTIKYLRVFGSTAYSHNKTMKGKLADRSCIGIFVGYDSCGYRIYDPINRKYITARDVIFDEFNYSESRPTNSNNLLGEQMQNRLQELMNHEQNQLSRSDVHAVDDVIPSTGTTNSNETLTINQRNSAPTVASSLSDKDTITQLTETRKSNTTCEFINPTHSTSTHTLEPSTSSDQKITQITETRKSNQTTINPSNITQSTSTHTFETSTSMQQSPPTSEIVDLHPNSDDVLTDIAITKASEHLEIVQPGTSRQDTPVNNTKNARNDKKNLKRKHLQEAETRRSDRQRQKFEQSTNPTEDYLRKLYPDFALNAQVVFTIPKSFKDIDNCEDRDEWIEAVDNELRSHQINKTFTIVPDPGNKNIIGSKWVFTIKHNEFGYPIKHKARLVALGCGQTSDDYSETYSPVLYMESFRILMAIANQYNLHAHSMDVCTAYLNGDLQEEVYMKIPHGVRKDEGMVCKLNRSIYGLKQSAVCWNRKIDSVLREYGFEPSGAEQCIYTIKGNSIQDNIYLGLYVDDVIIITGNMDKLNKLKAYLKSTFAMVDMNEIKMFVGIKVTRTSNTLSLDQSAYINTVLKKFNMEECDVTRDINKIPLTYNLNMEAVKSNEYYDAPCRNLLGCINYINSCTRPDISFATNFLARYVNLNNHQVWEYLKTLLRYLKHTKELKLTYVRKTDFNDTLIGYADASLGDKDSEDLRSTSGYLFKLFDDATITWKTKRQKCVALSSAEAEYYAACEAILESDWIIKLSKSLGLDVNLPIKIYDDSTSCISILNTPSGHNRTKHIELKFQKIKEKVKENTALFLYISTGKQLADTLTKPLMPTQFELLRNGIGMKY